MSSTPADAGRGLPPPACGRPWRPLAGAGRSAGAGHLAAAAPGLEARADRPRRRRSWPQPAHAAAGRRPVRAWTIAASRPPAPTCTTLAFAFGFSAEGGRARRPADHAVPPRRTAGPSWSTAAGCRRTCCRPTCRPVCSRPAPWRLEGIARWRGDATRGWMAPADTPGRSGAGTAGTSRPWPRLWACRSSRWSSSWSAPRVRPVCPRRSRSRSTSPTTI